MSGSNWKSAQSFANVAGTVVTVLWGMALITSGVALSPAAETSAKRFAKSHDAPKAARSLTDFWDGQATWVSDAEHIGIDFGFHFPSICPVGDEFWAYCIKNYTATDGKFKMTIGRARGTNGINWTDDGTVLDVGRGAQAKDRKTSVWDDRIASFRGNRSCLARRSHRSAISTWPFHLWSHHANSNRQG